MFLFCSHIRGRIEIGAWGLAAWDVEGGCARGCVCQGFAVDLVSCTRKTAADFAANGRHGDSGLRARARKSAGLAASAQPLRGFLLQISCRCSKRPRAEQSWVVLAANPPDRPSLPPCPSARPELTKPAGAGSTALPNDIRERSRRHGHAGWTRRDLHRLGP